MYRKPQSCDKYSLTLSRPIPAASCPGYDCQHGHPNPDHDAGKGIPATRLLLRSRVGHRICSGDFAVLDVAGVGVHFFPRDGLVPTGAYFCILVWHTSSAFFLGRAITWIRFRIGFVKLQLPPESFCRNSGGRGRSCMGRASESMPSAAHRVAATKATQVAVTRNVPVYEHSF